jgi:hypothetical protein
MKKFVFIDESIRGQYTIAAVIVPITKVGEYRRTMLKLRPKGSNSFHMGSERKNGRLAALKLILSLEYLQIIFGTSSQSSQANARQESLATVLNLLDEGEMELILDRTTMEDMDRETLFSHRRSFRGTLDFVHSDRFQDSGLWGADVLAWIVGTEHFNRNRDVGPLKYARLGAQPPAAS